MESAEGKEGKLNINWQEGHTKARQRRKRQEEGEHWEGVSHHLGREKLKTGRLEESIKTNRRGI